MVAIRTVQTAVTQRMFGDEKDAQIFSRIGGEAGRVGHIMSLWRANMACS